VRHNRGTLEPDREDRLRKVRGWSWDLRTDTWEEGFSRLLDYVEANGHARVAVTCEVDGFNLGGWAKKQRDLRIKGTLDPERERRLGELDGWSWGLYVDRWEEGFRRLQNYVETHGHARVPSFCALDDGYPLGAWVSEQRRTRAEGILG
jgi:hypothetical protein